MFFPVSCTGTEINSPDKILYLIYFSFGIVVRVWYNTDSFEEVMKNKYRIPCANEHT